MRLAILILPLGNHQVFDKLTDTRTKPGLASGIVHVHGKTEKASLNCSIKAQDIDYPAISAFQVVVPQLNVT